MNWNLQFSGETSPLYFSSTIIEVLLKHWKLPHLKIVHTTQGYIHKYENLIGKLHNCDANINFNQQYL
jgi:hypothetical protein